MKKRNPRDATAKVSSGARKKADDKLQRQINDLKAEVREIKKTLKVLTRVKSHADLLK